MRHDVRLDERGARNARHGPLGHGVVKADRIAQAVDLAVELEVRRFGEAFHVLGHLNASALLAFHGQASDGPRRFNAASPDKDVVENAPPAFEPHLFRVDGFDAFAGRKFYAELPKARFHCRGNAGIEAAQDRGTDLDDRHGGGAYPPLLHLARPFEDLGAELDAGRAAAADDHPHRSASRPPLRERIPDHAGPFEGLEVQGVFLEARYVEKVRFGTQREDQAVEGELPAVREMHVAFLEVEELHFGLDEADGRSGDELGDREGDDGLELDGIRRFFRGRRYLVERRRVRVVVVPVHQNDLIAVEKVEAAKLSSNVPRRTQPAEAGAEDQNCL